MVLFVELEDDESQDTPGALTRLHRLRAQSAKNVDSCPAHVRTCDQSCVTVNCDGMSAAVGCYPIARSIASHLDLNDLSSLSRTSRQVHDNLVQFSRQLVLHSLQCFNASQSLLSDVIGGHRDTMYIRNNLEHTAGQFAEADDGSMVQLVADGLSTSRISHCARDLVAPCRKCEKIVCRNCAAKPPSDRYLSERFRRLCEACVSAPLRAHLTPSSTSDDIASAESSQSPSCASSIRSISSPAPGSPPCGMASDSQSQGSLTAAAYLRGPCTCASRGVYLCRECGSNCRPADVIYKRVWTWRSRYSTHIGGGLGTGLGQGDQGQKCGRGARCLELCSSWVERECQDRKSDRNSGPTLEQDSAADSGTDDVLENRLLSTPSPAPSGLDSDSDDRSKNKPGYLQQEIQGIGGIVRKKVRERVKVGATVSEFDDERESRRYLSRAMSGTVRAWCGWCDRVVPASDESV